jgi:hypothetical protein
VKSTRPYTVSLRQQHCLSETRAQCSLSKNFGSLIFFLSFESWRLQEELMLLQRLSPQIKRDQLFHDYPSNATKKIGNFCQFDEVCIQPPYLKIPKAFLCTAYQGADKAISQCFRSNIILASSLRDGLLKELLVNTYKTFFQIKQLTFRLSLRI